MDNSQIQNMATTYEAREIETDIYKFWEDNECFKADAKSKKEP